MKSWLLITLFCLVGQLNAAETAVWRLDLLHAKQAGQEQFQVAGLWQEPIAWQGPTDLKDTLNRGDYRFEITHRDSGELLFAQSYSSLFADWSLSSEASHSAQNFEESLRFPAPQVPARLQVFRRQLDTPGQPFQPVWQLDLPRQADPAPVPSATESTRLLQAAYTKQAYGLVFLAEGFQADEAEAFFQAASELSLALFQHAPFDRLRPRMQVHAVMTPSNDSGIGLNKDGQALNTRFAVNPNALGMPRYALSMEVHAIRNAAMLVPYHSIVILTNSSDYHGSGIFQTYAIAPAFHPRREFLLLHELGHSLAGLADEYFHDTPGYSGSDGRIEPYQPNITSQAGLQGLKWQHLVADDTPIPTPWDQDAFMQNRQMSTLAAEPHQSVIGAFQGANYSAEHYYRPALACIMLLDMGDNHFCPVCQQAIVEQVYSRLGKQSKSK